MSTASLPSGWEKRAVPFERDDAKPGRAVCIEPHDLIVAKLVAGREKDIEKEYCMLVRRASLIIL
ncbi:MAG: hypothetical protein ACI9H8_001814 [Lysobacterales bacterium]|jgi:hypothetical protein